MEKLNYNDLVNYISWLQEGDGSILLSTPLGDGQDTPRGPGRSPAVNISSRSSTVIGDTPSKNVTQSSSLDTTTKPRKALKMADSTLKGETKRRGEYF